MSERTLMTYEDITRWIDAFPWIPGVSGSADAWWLSPIKAVDAAAREHKLGVLSDLMLERRSDWTVPALFVGLPLSTPLSRLPFSNRAANAFGIWGFHSVADLQDTKITDMLDWRSVGAGTVDGILRVFANASVDVDVAKTEEPERAQNFRASEHSSDAPSVLTENTQTIVDDLELIARWLVAKGHPTEELLSNDLTPGTPVEVVEARARLCALNANDLLPSVELDLDAAEQLRECFDAFTDRNLFVLSRRFFADDPETLDALGRELGVTRERVRQLETKARSALGEHIEPGGRLALVAAAARDTIGTVLPLSSLLSTLPALGHKVESISQPAWRVLDRLDDAYEIEDGWCVAPTMSTVKSAWSTKLQELANDYGVLPIEEVGPLNDNLPQELAEAVLAEWLVYCGYQVTNGFILTRSRSIPDRVSAMLYLEGTPMTSQEIVERFDGERSANSVRNAMAIDERIVRIDRDRWALTEWGVDAYEGIRSAIRRELNNHGGTLPIDRLQQVLTEKYSVAGTSVVTYAAMNPFETVDGVVRVARTVRQIRKTPAQTRKFFRHGHKWALRITVTKDHIRGSGYAAPAAIASLLDLQPGDSVRLPSTLGDQSIYWTGAQPSIGSIRRFLIADDIDAEHQVFLEFHDDRKFSVSKMEELSGDPVFDALTLAGASPNDCADPRVMLAETINQPKEATVSRLIEEFRNRGDGEIADLLTAARQRLSEPSSSIRSVPSTDIDEILDLL